MRVFKFGQFEFDEAAGELRSHVGTIRLQEKPALALVALLTSEGRIVTREQLRERLWPGGLHVDVEQGVANALLKVREALGDSARAPRFVETLPRRGYRWLEPVTVVDPVSSAPARRSQGLGIAAGLAAAVVAVGGLALWPRTEGRADGNVPADSALRESYLRARHLAARKTPGALRESVLAYRAVLAHQPDFAPAWSGLAASYHFLGAVSVLSWEDACRLATEAASRAMALDDRLAEAHAVLAETTFRFGPAGADPMPSFRRALELAPDAGYVQQWYANYLAYAGRLDDALTHMRRARDLDPLSLHINVDLAALLYDAGYRVEASEQLDRTLALDPHYPKSQFLRGLISLGEGRYEAAITALTRVDQLSPDTPKYLEALARAYAESGRHAEAQGVLARLRVLDGSRPLPPGLVARVEATLNRPGSVVPR